MAYSMAGLIAIFVTLIVNFDVFMKPKAGEKDILPARNCYRLFLLSVIAYFVCDGIWGILDYYHLNNLFLIHNNSHIFSF